jgi:hypothetical protein
LRGEPGIGKTALLEHLTESAADLTIIRTVGVDSEMELAYAGLHQLCAPLLDQLDALPAPQCDALRVVFGQRAGLAPDRLMVGLGVLSLLSDVADERPVLCVVDDAQWLDRASALTLAFVARRLLAEPVGIVFASREPVEALAHLPELVVQGAYVGTTVSQLQRSFASVVRAPSTNVRVSYVLKQRFCDLPAVDDQCRQAVREQIGGTRRTVGSWRGPRCPGDFKETDSAGQAPSQQRRPPRIQARVPGVLDVESFNGPARPSAAAAARRSPVWRTGQSVLAAARR